MKKLIAFVLLTCITLSLWGCTQIRRTESLDDYLKPDVPMSYSEFLLFPIRAALEECTVNRYRSVSMSDLLFDDNYLLLSCTYTQQQYDKEIERFEAIGAAYREDLFRYPAYVALFTTHSYEYALLDEEDLTIIYIAAHTIDFESSSSDKQHKDFPAQFAPVRIPQKSICIYDYGSAKGEIRIDGEHYTFFEHGYNDNWELNGIPAQTASRKQLISQLELCDPSIPDCGEICAAIEAAYYGGNALSRQTSNWTSADTIGAAYNENADVWIVHGMLPDGNDPAEAWAVVLDAETGKVLGFTELNRASVAT